jgi:hypothetical protein
MAMNKAYDYGYGHYQYDFKIRMGLETPTMVRGRK